MNNNWEYVTFDKLFEWNEKSKIKAGDGLKEGEFDFFVCSDTEVKKYNKALFNGEALIFGTGGNPSLHYKNGSFAYSTDCVVASKIVNEINLKFVYYYLRQGRLKQLQKGFKGSGLQHISKKYIEKILIPNIELEEQNRIVDKLDETFSELENGLYTLKRTKELVNVYRQSILKQAFDSVKSDNKTIEEICSNIVDCPHSTPKWTKTGKICLRTTNFRRNYLDLSEPNFVSEETFNLRNTRLIPKSGDILYSREGAILGIACMIPKDTFICLGQRMMLLRINKDNNNKYLMYFLNSPKLTNYVASITGGTASPHINVGAIKKFLIPAPSLDEQNKIVEQIETCFSVCDYIEEIINKLILQSEIMKQSILDKSFEGGLL